MEQLISCASYYGSGSSAVTDLIGEYEGVKSLTDYEFRFIQDIDGLVDLEYHLVKNHHRHNSGHALKRFMKLCEFHAGTWFDKRYEKYFNDQFLKLTQEYVDALCEFKFEGKWFMDMYDRGKWFYYWKSVEGKVRKRIPFVSNNKMAHEMTYCSHPTEDRFLALTRDYLKKLLKAANPDDAPRLMVDQLLPSSGINQCLRYFEDDVKLLVVDRDPRDVYLSEKFIWKECVIPTDVKLFCQWYRYTHESNRDETPDPNHVIKLQFEDMIYNYNEQVDTLEQFLHLSKDDHKRPFQGMNPQRSVHNTQLWKVYDDQEAMKVIEQQLPEYLYDFEVVKNNEIAGIKIDHIKRF